METTRLQIEIDKAAEGIKRGYYEAARNMEKLKSRLNFLQRESIKNNDYENFQSVNSLDSVEERISKLSDSLLIKSRKAWQTYDELERRSKALGLEQTRLVELQSLCAKMEKLAADLLCYSLGRLKRNTKLE